MSSRHVRQQFRSSWSFKVPGIDLLETINDDPNHDDVSGIWATVSFNAFNETAVSLGSPSCRREEGTIAITLSNTSGDGDNVLSNAAEQVRNAYRYWNTEGIRVTQIDPPLDPDGFSDGMNYIVDIDITYVYDNYI